MKQSRLIVVEGPDNIGKTTLVKSLETHAKIMSGDVVDIIHQPSGDNILGFLRSIVKSSASNLTPFERQLLHTVSHTVDAFMFDKSISTHIMDRSYISALVYGLLMGIEEVDLSTLYLIHRNLYKHVLKDVKVDLVLLTGEKPFKPKDGSVYEEINWNKVNTTYKIMQQSLTGGFNKIFYENHIESTGFYFFTPNESIHEIHVKSTDSCEHVLELVKQSIGL